MKLTKMHYDGAKVSMEYEEEEGRGMGKKDVKTTTFRSDQAPLPALPAALKAFAPYVMRLFGLSEKGKYVDTLEVRGVTVRYTKDGRRAISVSAIQKTARTNGPAIFNTPELEEHSDESTGATCLRSDEIELLDEAEKQFILFINGHREQLTLKLESEPENAPAVDEDAVARLQAAARGEGG